MKILIVDDEDLARRRLCRLLGKLRPEAELFEAADGREALSMIAAVEPGIVLLDIRMPDVDGVAVAHALLREAAAPAIIFCTAYDEYALDALRNQAIAYLLKPVRERELEKALQAAVRVNRAQLHALGVATGADEITSSGHRGVDRLAIADVRCFLAEDKYVRACAPSGELLLNESLKDLEDAYGSRFLRIHRNALVAQAHVQRLVRSDDGWVVELDSIDERPAISRRHLSAIKAALKGVDTGRR